MNKSLCLSLLFTIYLHTASAQTTMPDSVSHYIDTCITLLKDHSLYAHRVNWPAMKKKVYTKAAHAKNKAETFDALKLIFNALNDQHAAYYQYDDAYKLPNNKLTARYSDSLKAGWAKGPQIFNQMIGQVAYISIPTMGISKQTDIDKYTEWIRSVINKLQQKNPIAWIIDLRLNAGGNIRPMMSGLAPFFPDTLIGYYIDRNGQLTYKATVESGKFFLDGVQQANITTTVTGLERAQVRVLIGPGTASSAEGVAVAFSHRPNTRLVGQETAGLANATNGFVFNQEQSYFLISTASLADARGKRLPEFVRPYLKVKQIESFNNLANDGAVKMAIKSLGIH